jgi:hypothetical protein
MRTGKVSYGQRVEYARNFCRTQYKDRVEQVGILFHSRYLYGSKWVRRRIHPDRPSSDDPAH